MRLSKKFLADYVDIKNISFNEVANKMVSVGNEFESVSKLSDATGLIVGEVVACEKHPESTKLSICKVNVGEATHQILCGAANVAKGQKVVVAQIGAILPGGFEIKKAKLAGMDSEGMICSLAELGIDNKFLTEDDKNGIHVLGEDAVVGSDPLAYLGFDDEVIDFELTANRSDLLSVIGMAYEVGAIYDLPINLPVSEVNQTGTDINQDYSLTVKTSKCSTYLGKVVHNLKVGPSPDFIKARLMASGIRPINNVVDISNYVMLEYGQPLHFFDLEKLGHEVIVREAVDNEEIITLDGVTRTLKATDIVIANSKEAVAVAGVMGGLKTEVTEQTTDILIESAVFDPKSIRATAKDIWRSEASARFEKGIDANYSLNALNRACYLLSLYASGEVQTGLLSHEDAYPNEKEIVLSLETINSVLGMELTSAEVLDVFKKLKFEVIFDKLFTVFVPTRRLDISLKEDLIEEVGRMYGYDKIKSKLPTAPTKEGSYNKKSKFNKEVRSLLNSLGLNQVLTYSLVANNDLFVATKKEEIKLASPMSEDRKVLRQSLLPSLIEVFNYNSARNVKDINIFETGSIYYLENDQVCEDMHLAGLMSGSYLTNDWQGKRITSDFYLLKGVIESLLKYLGLNNRYSFTSSDLPRDFHPTKSAAVVIDRTVVGYMGSVHPLISKKDLYVFELDLEKLLAIKVRPIKYKEISKYPAVNKDLAFVVNKKTTSEEVMSIIKRVGGRLLANVDLFDLYVGDNVGADRKSLAYALTFQDASKTLSDEEINSLITKITGEVENKLDAKLRSK